MYAVKEMYLTLQGEGANAGRAAVFLRFAGCNLWTGREADRSRAVCQFCDTQFVGTDGIGGGKFSTAGDVVDAVVGAWKAGGAPGTEMIPKLSEDVVMMSGGVMRPLVVCTGGEPLLQLDASLLAALRSRGFEVAVESNGTIEAPVGIDWLTVSPKAGADWRQRSGQELKLVFPQRDLMPEDIEADATLRFEHYYLQPMDGPEREENTRLAIQYCLRHPRWRLSVQTHKLLGIP